MGRPASRSSTCCAGAELTAGAGLPRSRARGELDAWLDRRLGYSPARDPPQPPPRLPHRADAAGASELDARHRPRQAAPALADGRPGDGALVLQPAPARPAAAARGDAPGVLRPRALERAARERGAVPHRGAAPAAPRRSRTSRAGTTRSGRASSRRTATSTSSRTASWRTTCAGTTGSRRSACGSPGGRRPISSTDDGRAPTTRSSCAATGSTPGDRSCSSRGTRRATRRTRGVSSSGSSSGGRRRPSDRPQLLFRPHPRDGSGGSASPPRRGHEGVVVQEASYTDLEDLATLLQHVDVVVCNAGTILLDALVGDRPAVCVLYDEGAPPGESWAAKNVVGKHYEELAESGAFYRAERFDEVVAGIERALERPDELAEQRRRAVEQVVGIGGRRARPSAWSTRWRACSGRTTGEGRDDAPRAERGGHRRRADRIPPARRRRLT